MLGVEELTDHPFRANIGVRALYALLAFTSPFFLLFLPEWISQEETAWKGGNYLFIVMLSPWIVRIIFELKYPERPSGKESSQ